MAMILANLVDSKVTPVDTMKEAYGWHYCGAGISGTDAGYFQKSAKSGFSAIPAVSAPPPTPSSR